MADTKKAEHAMQRLEWLRDISKKNYERTKEESFNKDYEEYTMLLDILKSDVAKNETTAGLDNTSDVIIDKYPQHVRDIIAKLKDEANECLTRRERILAQIEAVEWFADMFLVKEVKNNSIQHRNG